MSAAHEAVYAVQCVAQPFNKGRMSLAHCLMCILSIQLEREHLLAAHGSSMILPAMLPYSYSVVCLSAVPALLGQLPSSGCGHEF